MSEEFISGSSCPNADCSEIEVCFDWRDHITKTGKTGNGEQRFRCARYSGTFSQCKNSFVYHKKTRLEEILKTLASLSKGTSLKGGVRGHRKETVQKWVNEAFRHRWEATSITQWRLWGWPLFVAVELMTL